MWNRNLKPFQRWIESLIGEWSGSVQNVFLLPKGEGQDEGEPRSMTQRRNIFTETPSHANEDLRLSQSFVRTPHARKKHQPRTASKMQNNPMKTGIKPAHHNVSPAMMMPAMSKVAPTMPRAMRPWKLIFRSKNRAISNNNLILPRAQIFGPRTCAGEAKFRLRCPGNSSPNATVVRMYQNQ